MPLEIERRFLVSGSDWREHAGEPQSLRQGYLASSEQGITVRMRLRADGRAWLTLKAPADGIARHEFEYDLPSSDAEALWALAPHRLVKTRYSLALPGGDWCWIVLRARTLPGVGGGGVAGCWGSTGSAGLVCRRDHRRWSLEQCGPGMQADQSVVIGDTSAIWVGSGMT